MKTTIGILLQNNQGFRFTEEQLELFKGLMNHLEKHPEKEMKYKDGEEFRIFVKKRGGSRFVAIQSLDTLRKASKLGNEKIKNKQEENSPGKKYDELLKKLEELQQSELTLETINEINLIEIKLSQIDKNKSEKKFKESRKQINYNIF